MKEAAGEANITVITIVLIGAVAAVGLILIPRLMRTVKKKNCCVAGGFYVSGKYCVNPGTNGYYNMNGANFPTDARFSACMAD